MITARPLVEADLVAVLELLHAYDRRWFGEAVLTAEDLRAEWSAPAFDLATDSEGWVDDVLVAFGTLGTRGFVELAVAEAWAGAGLEDALLSRWEQEARRRGFAGLHRHLPADDAPGRRLLESRGWLAERTGWLLRLAPETVVEPAGSRPGYVVRPLTESDLPVAYDVVRDAFAPWSPVPRSYADWRAGLIDRPDLALGHCRVATREDEVVGVCLVLDPPGGGSADGAAEAWVPQLAVLSDHRRQGLATTLLSQITVAARARGVPAVALYTHEDTGALALYERFGMVVRHTLVEYGLDLGTTGPAADADPDLLPNR